MQSHQININSKVVHYWTNGVTSTLPILFVHGFRGNHKGLMPMSRVFTDREVIIPDLPGYSGSQKLDGKHTFEAYATMLEEFCQAINLNKCDVVGHSFGASLSIVFAAMYPHRIHSLVLAAPVARAVTIEAQLGKTYYNLARFMPSVIRRRWIRSSIIDYASNLVMLKSPNRQLRRELTLDGRNNLPYLDDEVVLENFLSFYSTDLLSLAPRIKARTLIIFGSLDILSTMHTNIMLQKLIHDSQIEVIPNAGHIMPLEEPRELGSRVKRFLEEKN